MPQDGNEHRVEDRLEPQRNDVSRAEGASDHQKTRCEREAVHTAVRGALREVGCPPLGRARHAAAQRSAHRIDMQDDDEEHSQRLKQVNAVKSFAVSHFPLFPLSPMQECFSSELSEMYVQC